jgi:hypothetical protein
MLSKMMRPVDETVPEYEMLNKDTKPLDKYKLPELKLAARYFGLRVGGNKTELKMRLIEKFDKTKKLIKIQKTFRGNLARMWIKLKKGTGEPSVNDTDFYTMDPIEEMDFMYYIHYTEEAKETTQPTSYVFNINSLVTLMLKNGKLENPYTRQDMKKTLGEKMLRIINLTSILFPHNDLMKNSTEVMTEIDKIRPAIPIDPTANYQNMANELFMRIDSLGNYTNVEWFNGLSNAKLCTLILRIYYFWGFIDRQLKMRICPHKSPFSIDNLGIEMVSTDRPIEENRAIAIRVGETLVYDGATDEYRTLGAMYFVTGMTIVCEEAREQMPWLYDNYFAVTRRN